MAALEVEAGQVLGGGTKGRKLQQLQNDVAALEAALVAAEAEYDKVKDRNKEVRWFGGVQASLSLQELQRWRGQRAHDMATMLGAYGKVEAAYADRSSVAWRGVAEEFGVAAPGKQRMAGS